LLKLAYKGKPSDKNVPTEAIRVLLKDRRRRWTPRRGEFVDGKPCGGFDAGTEFNFAKPNDGEISGRHDPAASLVLSSSSRNSRSNTDSGAIIPAESSPSRLFSRIFIEENSADKAAHEKRVAHGQTIKEPVKDDAKRLAKSLGSADRERLDNYSSSVRDLELRMAKSKNWAKLPKPIVDFK